MKKKYLIIILLFIYGCGGSSSPHKKDVSVPDYNQPVTRRDEIIQHVLGSFPDSIADSEQLGLNEYNVYCGNSLAKYFNYGYDRLLIYHHGHGGTDDTTWLDQFSGYDLAIFKMPDAPHEQYFDSEYPMKPFLEPVLIFLNTFEYDTVVMAGLSGGGWTTVWVSALDVRIDTAFSIAGSLPLYMRNAAERGDIEQYYLAVYDFVGYEELYDLSGIVNIYNSDDPCCFWERSGMPGYVVQNDKHTISQAAVDIIKSYIGF